jgi:hypothetical protein
VLASRDEYRRHAAECVRLAQKVQNPRDKALLLTMADSWIRLADKAANRAHRITPAGLKKER